jgi:hypothetical protein
VITILWGNVPTQHFDHLFIHGGCNNSKINLPLIGVCAINGQYFELSYCQGCNVGTLLNHRGFSSSSFDVGVDQKNPDMVIAEVPHFVYSYEEIHLSEYCDKPL